MRPAALVMGAIFVILGLAVAVDNSRTYVWILLVLGGLIVIYYALRRKREINFEPRRSRVSQAFASISSTPATGEQSRLSY